jgi:microcystin-dependent protein
MPVMQPSLALNYFINETGASTTSGHYPLVGQVRMMASSVLPGSTPTDGTQLSVSSNPDLAAILGSTYGGNGVTTTNVPDLRGRLPIGTGTGTGLTTRSLGQQVGAESVTLAESQLPVHTHTLPGGGATAPEGGGQAYDNMQPSMALHYMIAIAGIYPSRSKAAPDVTGNPYLGQISLFAGDTAPTGWMFCDGQELSSTLADNLALYSLLGTTYGGDGIDTFALPDLRGRAGIGVGNFTVEGETEGVESQALTVGQMAAHTHEVPEPASAALALACLLGLARRRR